MLRSMERAAARWAQFDTHYAQIQAKAKKVQTAEHTATNLTFCLGDIDAGLRYLCGSLATVFIVMP